MEPDPELLFEVLTPLGFRVRVTRERWSLITSAKHPVMAGRDTIVKTHWRIQSRSARAVPTHGYYCSTKPKGTTRWMCAVVKQAADQGFLITAYPTDAIKEGNRIWPK